MQIKVLGTGCPNCVRLENNVGIALEQSGKKATVEKITDIAEIMSYGVMGTPALVIDGKVFSVGKVNEVSEIVSFLQNNSCCSGGGDIPDGCCPDKESCDIACTPKKANTGGCSCGGNC